MRTQEEMFTLILSTAREDSRIRAVYLNGSRANPNAPRDPFQDYDVVYVVTQTEPFLADPHWIDRFGQRLIWQEPDLLDSWKAEPMDFSVGYTWLLQFTDGNRIDLHIQTLNQALKEYGADSLTVCLLDKDGCLPPLPPADDRDYLEQLPTQQAFFACCNEFWWVSLYVAKGLWRAELSYAAEQRDCYVRPQLRQLLTWLACIQAGRPVCAGKNGKYLPRYLTAETWQAYLDTYTVGREEAMWDGLEHMGTCFQAAAREVARAMAFPLDEATPEACMAYMRHVRALNRSAAAIC